VTFDFGSDPRGIRLGVSASSSSGHVHAVDSADFSDSRQERKRSQFFIYSGVRFALHWAFAIAVRIFRLPRGGKKKTFAEQTVALNRRRRPTSNPHTPSPIHSEVHSTRACIIEKCDKFQLSLVMQSVFCAA